MTTENVYKLLELAAKDATLRIEIESSGHGEAGVEAAIAAGKKRGLDFTADDLLQALAHLRDGVPLSDEDLAKVTGGNAAGIAERIADARKYFRDAPVPIEQRMAEWYGPDWEAKIRTWPGI